MAEKIPAEFSGWFAILFNTVGFVDNADFVFTKKFCCHLIENVFLIHLLQSLQLNCWMYTLQNVWVHYFNFELNSFFDFYLWFPSIWMSFILFSRYFKVFTRLLQWSILGAKCNYGILSKYVHYEKFLKFCNFFRKILIFTIFSRRPKLTRCTIE